MQHNTVVSETSEKVATLDAAGYGILVLCCNDEADIRRVISNYAFQIKSKKTKYPCKDSNPEYIPKLSENMLEATALGTVRVFNDAFCWSKHGLSEEHTPPYSKSVSLIQFLESCTTYPTCMQHRLLYIPNITDIIGANEQLQKGEMQIQYTMLLKDLARLKRIGKCNALVVIGCTNGVLCNELMKDSYILNIPYPDTKEIVDVIEEACKECDAGNLSLTKSHINELAEIMRGFRENDIRNIFRLAFASAQFPTAGNADALFKAAREAKKQLIKGVAGLQWLNIEHSEIGGLSHLRYWLEKKRLVFAHPYIAQLQKATPPKGVLLCGLPGCGKTTLARYAAKLLGTNDSPLPLLQMNISDFNNKWIGESEANCNIALRTIESVAPCVLLIDEIEKVFSSVGNGSAHEVTMHLFSAILDWMQKPRTKPIFVIATANKTESLPPELKRKGRFDEIFFVGVPSKAECHEIFRVHLNKKLSVIQQRNLNMDDMIDSVLQYAACKKRFLNGADIESIIDAAFCELFVSHIKSISEEKLNEKDDWITIQYTQAEVVQVLKNVLEDTRSYFDNNLKTTAMYWVDMYEQKFHEAGGYPLGKAEGRDTSADYIVLPATEGVFDTETGMFHFEQLQTLGLLSNDNFDVSSTKDNYQKLLDEQLNAAESDNDYDGVFRWILAKEIFHLYTK